jgi:hypothetical protein
MIERAPASSAAKANFTPRNAVLAGVGLEPSACFKSERSTADSAGRADKILD